MQILVVEDEQRMAELLRRTLQEEGHQVIMASDGKEGFEIARSSPFDVIILDVMLPGMDGMTVARQLRERRNQTPMLGMVRQACCWFRGLDSMAVGAETCLT